MSWDDGVSDVGYENLYYCMVCEKFFRRSPIAPGFCPTCWADDRYVLGPLPHKKVDLNKLIRKKKLRHGHAMRK
jgi:hypothetical protein